MFTNCLANISLGNASMFFEAKERWGHGKIYISNFVKSLNYSFSFKKKKKRRIFPEVC